MNLFKKIRELKFPFIAVVAALTFGGLVSPASAVVPTVTSFSRSTPSSTSTQISFTVSKQGSCKALLRSTLSSAAIQADVLAATGPGGQNIDFVVSPVAVDGAMTSISFSGLTTGTTYNAYIVCLDGASGDASFLQTYGFTQAAAQGSGVAPQNQQQQASASVRNPAPAFKINSRPTVSANGQMLTLNGENLGDVTGVKVAGKEAKISKKANGELVIEVPAGTEGFPDVEVLHSGGTVSMQGLIQVLKPYSKVRTQTITQFVGNRPTLAGLAALEQAYLAGTTANVLTCVATVASDASAAEITATETRAKATCQRVVNYSKYIKAADVHISKDGAAGSKSVLAVTFDRTLDGK